MAASYCEVNEWPRIKYNYNGAYAERRLLCEWADWPTVAAEIDAYPTRIFPYDSSGAQISQIYVKPAPKTAMTSTSGSIATYNHAHLLVNYSTQYATTAELISERFSSVKRFSRYNTTNLAWQDGVALNKGEAPGKLDGGLTYLLRYHRAPFVPTVVGSLQGYINSNTVQTKTLGISFYAGALLYLGANVSRIVTAGGATAIDLQHVFAYSDHGWNYVWRSKTNQYELVYDTRFAVPVLAHPSTTFAI